jgi:thiamine-phosphate pyrophosphorylase
MRRRHLPALPCIWMLTDERQGAALEQAVARLPRHIGVIVRHYSLAESQRRSLAARLLRQGHVVAFSGPTPVARALGAHAVYGADRRPGRLPRLYPVHSRADISAAERAGAEQLLLSPVFPTRSHPGAWPLGPMRFAALARTTRLPVIALGGMTAKRFDRLRPLGARGWAAIDHWIG